MSNNKLELLVRRNRGKREIQGLITSLSEILKISLTTSDFIDLEETDRLTTLYYEGLRNNSNIIAKRYYESEILSLTDDLKVLLPSINLGEVYLLLKQSSTCGTIKVSLNSVIAHFEELIKLDGDSLCTLSLNERSGLHIDYFEEFINNTPMYFYELSIWE